MSRLRERTSLRTQLVVVVLLLSAVTVVSVSVATALLLRTQLMEQVDEELWQSARPVVEGLERGDLPPPQPVPDDDPFRQSSLSVTLFDSEGTVLAQQIPASTDLGSPTLPTMDAEGVADHAGEPFTVDADGGGSWRVLVLAVGDDSVALALPLTGVQQTLQQLVIVDVVLLLVALGILALLARWAVAASLRPLVAVERTAQAIAGGDLSRRVPEHPETTEIGRLSGALNTMLGQIETSMHEEQQATESAQASEARMRRFVADASHELRTPLTSIRGFSELYRQGAVPSGPALEQTMRRIEDEAQRMGLLVEDLLLLARLDQQRPLEKQPVDLGAIAAGVAHDAAILAPDHQIVMDHPPQPASALVLGDETRLRQVVSNLVRNAHTHTPAGTTVRVDVQPRAQEVLLTVSDDGPGMAADDAQRAFERFYRADSSRSRTSGSGSGLGLSIVAALVAAHAGTVDLRSTVGQGTTVAVCLPRVSAH